MATQKDVQRSFRLDPKLNAKLIAKAEECDRSVSWLIVRFIEEALVSDNDSLEGVER